MTITCADCGSTQIIPSLPPGATAECHRCDRLLAHRTPAGLDVSLACAVAIFALLPPAVFMPLMRSTIKHLLYDQSRLVSSVSLNVANGATAPPGPPLPTPPPAPTPAALIAAFATPAAGATVSGTTTVTMSATGGTAPYTYTLALDGAPLVSGAAASYAWNTTAASNAAHTLSLTVRDAAGVSSTATRTVTVANTVTSSPSPSPTGTLRVFVTQPQNGGTVTGTVWPTLWVEGQSGTSNTFTISVNGQVLGSQVTSSRGPVSIPWITTGTANGAVSLSATVRDATGNTGSTTISVSIRN